jgi:hypothetical protein
MAPVVPADDGELRGGLGQVPRLLEHLVERGPEDTDLVRPQHLGEGQVAVGLVERSLLGR